LKGNELREMEYVEMLLRDVLKVMGSKKAMRTVDILEALKVEPLSYWRKFQGTGLDSFILSRLLKKLDVAPKAVRFGRGRNAPVARGYLRGSLEAAAGMVQASSRLDPEAPILLKFCSSRKDAYRATGTQRTREGLRTVLGVMFRGRGRYVTIWCDLFPCRVEWKEDFYRQLGEQIKDYVLRIRPRQAWLAIGPVGFHFQVRSIDAEEWKRRLEVVLANSENYALRRLWAKRVEAAAGL
jgi:hypothetical protein